MLLAPAAVASAQSPPDICILNGGYPHVCSAAEDQRFLAQEHAQSMERMCAGLERKYEQCYADAVKKDQENLERFQQIPDPYERRTVLSRIPSFIPWCGTYKTSMRQLGCF
jgi:hypothetical protein